MRKCAKCNWQHCIEKHYKMGLKNRSPVLCRNVWLLGLVSFLCVLLYITPLVIDIDHDEQTQHLHISDDCDDSFSQAALTGSISQIHSCGKNSAVTLSPGTSKAIRKTISAVFQARRPAKEGEGERGTENQVEGNTERTGQQRGGDLFI